MELKLGKIVEILGGNVIRAVPGSNDTIITRVITDTRVFEDGVSYGDAVFVALKGDRFDANEFVYEAAARGVALVVTSKTEVDTEKISGGTVFVSAENTLLSLGKIAREHRIRFSPKTVGITGSVGKTTTKELVYHVVAGSFKTLKTEASFNNEIGVPRTLMTLNGEYGAMVVEMGMRGFGQVDFLAGCSLPDVGVITNIGCAHLEIMGTKENTLRAKLEIAKYVKTLILNGDDQLLGDRAKVSKILEEYGACPEIVYFGLGENCDIMGTIAELRAESTEFSVYTAGKKAFDVKLKAPGVHNVSAALAAVAVAMEFGIAENKIKEALESFTSEQTGRQKIEKFGEITVIDDCFNAGPESMKASLSLLKALGGERKVAFLGDMLELGDVSSDEHKGVGVFAAKAGVNLVVSVGHRAKEIGLAAARAEKGTCVVALDDSEAAAESVGELLKPGDTVLVKGSHAMEMGKIVEAIKKWTC